MIVDTNILLYARDRVDQRSDTVAAWLEDALNGTTRVGFPWLALVGFVRIATSPRTTAVPLAPAAAWGQVDEWLATAGAWIATETDRHAEVMGGLVTRYSLAGPIISDAHLAALAIEHGVALASTDGDFARFTELRWINPLASP